MMDRILRQLGRVSLATRRSLMILYLLVLTTGTHWPRLRPPLQSVFPVDKVIHILAFCALTLLTAWAAWIPFRTANVSASQRLNLAFAAVAVLLWAGVDEWTQEFEWVNRQASLADWLADAGGVLLAVTIASVLRAARFHSTPKAATGAL